MSTEASHRAILRRVGLALIIFGLIDIAVMIYCIANGLGYSSSFNIFAVAAGILLFRGSIRTTRLVTSAAAFFLSAFSLMSLLLLFGISDLEAGVFLGSLYLLVLLGVLGFLYWVYAQLRLEPVLQARRNAGLSDKPPKAAFIAGLLFVPLVVAVTLLMIGRDGPYKDLEKAFPRLSSVTPVTVVSSSVVLTSTRHRGAFSYTDVLRVGLSDRFVDIEPKFPISLALGKIQIPIESVSGCSKTCGAWWDADLLIDSTGTEISIPESQETLEWCWHHQIPIVSGKDRREWLYNKARLPEKEKYAAQLASRDKYDRQARLSCVGY